MGETPIEWTDATWNPIGGCAIESAGCAPCYAQQLAGTRLSGHPLYAGTTTATARGKPVFNGLLKALPFDHPTWSWPSRWRGAAAPRLGSGRPSLIFVGDMADLFHEARPLGYATRIWMTAYRVQGRHIFQLLTKRPGVMLDFVRRWHDVDPEDLEPCMARGPAAVRAAHGSGRASLFADYLDVMGNPPAGAAHPLYDWMEGPRWWASRPYNVWLGFSAERQAEFDARWPAMRELARLGYTVFLSYEPAIGALRLPDDFLALGPRAWVIAGGMSGHEATPAHPDWFRGPRDQCAAAGTPFFFKQWGPWKPISEMGEGEVDALYRPRRLARGFEDQGTLDELYGRRCIVPDRVLGYGGATGPDGYRSVDGHGGMHLFRVGKAKAGRRLDGVIHGAFPEASHG